MAAEGLIHAESQFPRSYTLIVAFLLLAIGLLAVMSLAFHVGPFG
jgi:putative membrane protein